MQGLHNRFLLLTALPAAIVQLHGMTDKSFIGLKFAYGLGLRLVAGHSMHCTICVMAL